MFLETGGVTYYYVDFRDTCSMLSISIFVCLQGFVEPERKKADKFNAVSRSCYSCLHDKCSLAEVIR